MSRLSIASNKRATETKAKASTVINKVVIGQAELDALLANNIANLQSTVTTKNAEIALLQYDIESLQTDITTKTAELAVANQSLTALQSQYDVAVEDLAAAEAEVASLTSDLATANAALSQAQSDLAAANASLTQAQADLAQCQSDLQTANTNLSTAQSDLVTANATIADLQTQLQNAGAGGDVTAEPLLESFDTWTYYQGPNIDLLDSYSYDTNTGRHTFTVKAAGASPLHYCLNSDANGGVQVPRWYKPLTYSDGSPVLNTDSIILQIKLEEMEHPDFTRAGLMMGIMKIPDSTGSVDVAAFGGGGGPMMSVAGSVIATNGTMGSQSLHASPTPDYTSDVKIIATTSGFNKMKMNVATTGWNAPSPRTYTSTGIQSFLVVEGTPSMYQFNTPDGTQLYLCAWLTTRNVSDAVSAGTFSTKISYAVEKW